MRFGWTVAVAVMVTSWGAGAQAGSVSPGLAHRVAGAGPQEALAVIVQLSPEGVEVPGGEQDPRASRRVLIERLRARHAESSRPVVAWLSARGISRFTSLWLINALALRARPAEVEALAALPGVVLVRADETSLVPLGVPAAPPEWNVQQLGASTVWERGATGEGVVVGLMDTGVDLEHPDLATRWRGGDHGWFDPAGEHPSPTDLVGHGTQALGLVLGGGAGGTTIGVAPDAQWIAVKLFDDSGASSYSAAHQGFQWLLDPDGDPATDDGPAVVANAWTISGHPGECVPEFRTDVQLLRAAGIAVVFAAGNDGGLGTSVSPANYPESFAVGATDQDGKVASFSSGGPSACDGRSYPDVVVPGVALRTADLTLGGVFPSSYVDVTGTSFSAAEAAGAIALLRSAEPGASMDSVIAALEQTARDVGVSGPDDRAGWGALDVAAALEALRASQPVDGDGDGAAANVDCNDADASIHPGAVEVISDGVDQDCNGYDLTIAIPVASYGQKAGRLTVEASSALGPAAALAVEGYGQMKWVKNLRRWRLVVNGVAVAPSTVTVSGVEGAVTRAVSTTR